MTDNTINLGETGVLITDFDDVLVPLSPLWYLKVRRNWDHFSPYFKDFGEQFGPLDVLARKTYDLLRWLKKDNMVLPNSIISDFYSLYTECDDFYSELTTTTFCDTIQVLSNQNVCKKIYILTSTMDGTHESKLNFYNKNIKNKKTELIMLPISVKKSTAIKEQIGDYDIFIDDSSAVLVDVILNTESYFKRFMYPMLGHNNPEENKTLKDAAATMQSFLYGYAEVI